jgi:hypothetical protein
MTALKEQAGGGWSRVVIKPTNTRFDVLFESCGGDLEGFTLFRLDSFFVFNLL